MLTLRNIISAALGATAAFILYAAASAAEAKIALVIGNSSYKNTVPLKNPLNDAQAIASKLTGLGFTVLLGKDLDEQGMRKLVRDFSRQIDGEDVALFFYAGHGLQVNGVNYLIPTDAELSSENTVETEAFRLDFIMEAMQRSADTSIVFLDSCRNNPLAENLARSMGTRSVQIGRGLAQIDTSLGAFVGFATQPGNVALDGSGRNSPFTSALLQYIDTPGVDVEILMRKVRDQVIESTNGRQVPWSSSSLTGKGFVFKEIDDGQSTGSSHDVEIAYWNSVKDLRNTALLDSYLKRYPNGSFAEIAKLLIDSIDAEELAKAEAKAKMEAGKKETAELDLSAASESARSPDEEQQSQQSSLIEQQTQPQENAEQKATDQACEQSASEVGGKCLEAGASFRDCPDCPELVVVKGAAQQAALNSKEQENDAAASLGGVALGKYEITFEEWDRCVQDGGCKFSPQDQGWGRDRQPVINVSYKTIETEFLPWLNQKGGYRYRLPTEYEWTLVATLATNNGAKVSSQDCPGILGNARSLNDQCDDGFEFTAPVGSFSPNAIGLHDLYGNVWEWTSSCWSAEAGAPETGACKQKVIMGGSYSSEAAKIGPGARGWADAGRTFKGVGFRIARDLP
jgi:formylglycine-generating enzyme required for sulfatase activity